MTDHKTRTALPPVTLAALIALVAVGLLPPAATAAPPEPGVVITIADVEKVLGGKFKARSPEPGIVFYEEEGGEYRGVQVFLFPANGKTVDDMKANFTQQGEPVEDVAGVGDAALYRPQRSELAVEKKDKSGEVLWLEVGLPNVTNAKRFAIELGKLGAAKL